MSGPAPAPVPTSEAPQQPRAGVRQPRSRHRGIHARPSPWLVVMGSILIVAFFTFPYALMVISSLKSPADIMKIPPDYLPAGVANWSGWP